MPVVFKKCPNRREKKNKYEERLLDLRFANDVALTMEDVKDMEHQLNAMIEDNLKVGLKIHKGKTKLVTNFDTTDNIQIKTQQTIHK